MNENYRVGGYVKLAKLWERKKEESIKLHEEYYKEMFKETPDMELVDVYIDITGNKNIWKRPGMLQLIKDCKNKKVNCIATQTKAYILLVVRLQGDQLLMDTLKGYRLRLQDDHR